MRIRALTCLVLSLFLARSAFAEPEDKVFREAQRRFAKGNALYGDGHYEQALRLYLAAYELLPSPDILFNIGLAREKILDYEGCAQALQRYLAETTDEGAGKKARARAADRLQGCLRRAEIPVRISSIPPGAAIKIGVGKSATFRGRTPSEFKLAPADYVISVELPGYVAMSQNVKVEPGARPQVDFPLEKLSTLAIEADVSGAWVTIGERPPEPAPHRTELRAGRYQVRVFKEGYHDLKREVRIEPGEQSTLMVTLRPAPVHRILTIATTPAGASVRIDGKAAGRAPLERKAKAGTHRIEVAAPGRIPYAASITVAEERDTSLAIQLSPERTRSNRAVFWGLMGSAGVAGAAGAVYGLLALSDESEYGDSPTLSLADRGTSRARRADVLLGTAVVLAGAAILYHVVTRPAPARAEEQ
jgi:hypothetical protein